MSAASQASCVRRRLGTSLARPDPRSVSPGEAKHKSLASWHGERQTAVEVSRRYLYVLTCNRLIGIMVTAVVSVFACGVTEYSSRRWCTENLTLLLSRVSAVASGELHRVVEWWRAGGRWLAESLAVGSAQAAWRTVGRG